MDITSGGISVRTTNVKAFSVRLGSLPEDVKNAPFLVDGQSVELDEASWDQPDFFLALARDQDVWNVSTILGIILALQLMVMVFPQPYPLFDVKTTPPTGRILNVLNSTGPLTIVVPSWSPSQNSQPRCGSRTTSMYTTSLMLK